MNLKAELLKRFFKPCATGFLLNPFYIARTGLYKELKRQAASAKGRLLDIGCGTKPYAELFPCSEYIGLEYSETGKADPLKKADVFYSGDRFPFEDASFDTVFSSQVMEHVFKPDLFLEEIKRCLKPGGEAILTVPFVWEEHEPPYDYARYTSFALKHLAAKHGFEIVSQTKVGAPLSAILQLLLAYMISAFPLKGVYFNYVATAPFILPANLLSAVLPALLPGDEGLYLDNVLRLRKTK